MLSCSTARAPCPYSLLLEMHSSSRICTAVATTSLTIILTAWIEERLPLISGLIGGRIDGFVLMRGGGVELTMASHAHDDLNAWASVDGKLQCFSHGSLLGGLRLILNFASRFFLLLF